MAPALQLHLDQDPPRFTGGETLSGRVAVRLDGAPPPKRLRLKLWWAARGKQAQLDHRSLFSEQDLSVREDGTLPFQFSLPHTPLSWASDDLQVHWTVTARLQWDGQPADVVDSRDLVLLPGEAVAPDIVQYADTISSKLKQDARHENRRLGLKLAAVIGAMVVVQGLLGLTLDSESVALRIGVAVFAALVLLGAWPTLFPALSRRNKMRSAVSGLPEVLFLGGRYPVAISGPDGKPMRWELQWTERDQRSVRRGGGGDRAIKSLAWSEHPRRVAGSEAVGAVELELPIPETAPASFVCPTRRIDWQILVWVGDHPVEVHPLVVAPVLADGVSR